MSDSIPPLSETQSSQELSPSQVFPTTSLSPLGLMAYEQATQMCGQYLDNFNLSAVSNPWIQDRFIEFVGILDKAGRDLRRHRDIERLKGVDAGFVNQVVTSRILEHFGDIEGIPTQYASFEEDMRARDFYFANIPVDISNGGKGNIQRKITTVYLYHMPDTTLLFVPTTKNNKQGFKYNLTEWYLSNVAVNGPDALDTTNTREFVRTLHQYNTQDRDVVETLKHKHVSHPAIAQTLFAILSGK